MCIPKKFETFHFTRATEGVLSKTEELNSELHCRVYYCLFKRKMKRIKDKPNSYASMENITYIYIFHLIIIETPCLKHI